MCEKTRMNPLAKYLSAKSATGQRQADAARAFGISQSYLSEIASGQKRPSLDTAFRIERKTGGEVPASSWVAVEAPASGGAQ